MSRSLAGEDRWEEEEKLQERRHGGGGSGGDCGVVSLRSAHEITFGAPFLLSFSRLRTLICRRLTCTRVYAADVPAEGTPPRKQRKNPGTSRGRSNNGPSVNFFILHPQVGSARSDESEREREREVMSVAGAGKRIARARPGSGESHLCGDVQEFETRPRHCDSGTRSSPALGSSWGRGAEGLSESSRSRGPAAAALQVVARWRRLGLTFSGRSVTRQGEQPRRAARWSLGRRFQTIFELIVRRCCRAAPELNSKKRSLSLRE